MSDEIKNMYEELEDDIYRKRLQKLTDMGKGKLLDIFSQLETEVRILEKKDMRLTFEEHHRFKKVYDLIVSLP